MIVSGTVPSDTAYFGIPTRVVISSISRLSAVLVCAFVSACSSLSGKDCNLPPAPNATIAAVLGMYLAAPDGSCCSTWYKGQWVEDLNFATGTCTPIDSSDRFAVAEQLAGKCAGVLAVIELTDPKRFPQARRDLTSFSGAYLVKVEAHSDGVFTLNYRWKLRNEGSSRSYSVGGRGIFFRDGSDLKLCVGGDTYEVSIIERACEVPGAVWRSVTREHIERSKLCA